MRLLGEIVDSRSSDDAYERARDLHDHSMVNVETGWIFHPLWLLWGGLTDWPEIRPDEASEAAAAMRRAASEFFALDVGDDPAVRAYFDRWLYEELHYGRP